MVSKVFQDKINTMCKEKKATDCLKTNTLLIQLESCFTDLWQQCVLLAEGLDVSPAYKEQKEGLSVRMISVVSCTERLLMDSIRAKKGCSEDLDTVVEHYSSYIDVNKLMVQLSMFLVPVSVVDSTTPMT